VIRVSKITGAVQFATVTHLAPPVLGVVVKPVRVRFFCPVQSR
jgi:hypothetical protein